MKLTAIISSTAKPKNKPYKLSDGLGMYLYIQPNGHKYWRLKYRYLGKEKILALGVYPEISLKDARERRDIARKQLANGIDPNNAKQELKQKLIEDSKNTFEHVAIEWHTKNLASWSKNHGKSILKSLQRDLFAKVEHRPIRDITSPELLKTLQKMEERGAIESARRILQVCGQIFRYAIVTGRANRDIAADLKGALTAVKKEHYTCLSAEELPGFMQNVDNIDDAQLRLALKLLILTFVRTIELRGAKWEEINWDKAEWRIPAERMKMKGLHIVPLSNQAIDVLRQLQKISGNRQYIFPNSKNPDTFISGNVLLHAIYDMGYKNKTTIHGFRATASTILNENGFYPDVIERQLSHTDKNKVRAAYNHAQYIPERKKMMQWWGDYIDKQNGNNVIYKRFA